MNMDMRLSGGMAIMICLLAMGAGPAEKGRGGEPSRFALTIPSAVESPQPAVVRQLRRVDLPADGVVDFADVPALLDVASVRFRNLTAAEGTILLEQSFVYDLISPDAMLRKHVGRDMLINRRTPPDDKGSRATETKEGRLLAYDEKVFVLETRNLQMPIEVVPRSPDIVEIKLFASQSGIVSRPTLRLKVKPPAAGPAEVELLYVTGGLRWEAQYTAMVNAARTIAEISGLASITNESGAGYRDAQIRLAGEGGRAIEAPMTLVDRTSRQVEILPPQANVAVSRMLVFDLSPSAGPNPTVGVHLVTKNAKAAGLLGLPPGRVRTYSEAADGQAMELSGEGRLWQMDDAVAFAAGVEPAVTGLRQVREAAPGRQTHRVTLANAGRDAAQVTVLDVRDRPVLWTVEGRQGKPTLSRSIRFQVEVPAGATQSMEYTVEQ